MKRNILTVSVLFALMTISCAEESYKNKVFNLADDYGSVTVLDDKLIFDSRTESGNLVTDSKYDIFKGTKTNYIILHQENENVDFLTLVKSLSSLKKYANWQMQYVNVVKSEGQTIPVLVGMNVLNAESFVSEKDNDGNTINFVPEKNFNVIDVPWAVSKDSKCKTIHLNFQRYRLPNTKYKYIEDLYIINGFLNPEKPYLYEYNSRAKKIRISYGNISKEYVLKDTGNYQKLHLPEPINPADDTTVTIEIESSYDGTKYSDIVISGILYMDEVLSY